MAATVMVVCRGVRLICEAAALYNKVGRLVSDPDASTTDKTVSVGSSILILGLGLSECGVLAHGGSNKTLSAIKITEVCARAVDVPIKLLDEMANPNSTMLTAVEKGVLAPVSSLIRSVLEANGYQFQVFLEMTPEELSRVQIPIIEYVGSFDGAPDIIGYKGITREEVQAFLKSTERDVQIASVAELVLKTSPISTTELLYTHLAKWLKTKAPQQGEPPSLLSLPTIPQALHNDEIFKRYRCSVTLQPLRYPVGDKNGQTLYEKSVIVALLQQNPISPVTGQTHTVAELVPKPALQKLIDKQLAFHQDRLNAFE